ncbi:MAG: long-chain fatty acid--CoA ligase [Acidobacteria bacterium]|nr:long-chain fatty acid--CoA ligase [Acidobacteriota bacterium]MBP8273387.1 long-chain fatty acid--CoA ligase [Acidobacteriota bacterium]
MSETPEGIPETLALLPFFVAGRFPSPHLIGVCRSGHIEYTRGSDLLAIVRDISLGLETLGVTRGTRVALLAESRPEWLFVDMAILAAGAVTVPIYPTVSAAQVEALLADSGSTVVIASTSEQMAKVAQAAERLPSLSAAVILQGVGTAGHLPVFTLAEISERGHRAIVEGQGVGRAFHDRARVVEPSDLATIIYTSGSSGEPKGVMLTHANIVSNLRDVQQVLSLSEADAALSFLPLCHAFERTTAYVYLTHGVSVVFAESIDTMPRDLLLVRPTVMSGVPRVYEKLLDRILEGGRALSGVQRRLFDLAMAVARERGRTTPERKSMALWAQAALPLVRPLVFTKILARVGGRLRFAVSGSAPLREEVGRIFFGMGLPIAEGYGLTETSPVLTVNPPDALRFGTVGTPLPSVQLRIADDGEILAKGPNIMTGYFKRPDLTAEVLIDGWFHTGDVGVINADGYLRITDRKKELLVTSGGKKVAPQPLEAALRGQPMIGEAIVVGDRQRFPATLILPRWSALAQAVGAPAPTNAAERQALANRADVRAAIQVGIDEVNAPLAQFERLKAFAIVVDDFSIASGELTPTLKVKRRVIEERYAGVIAQMYSGGTTDTKP